METVVEIALMETNAVGSRSTSSEDEEDDFFSNITIVDCTSATDLQIFQLHKRRKKILDRFSSEFLYQTTTSFLQVIAG
ncbi:Hypothetical predicted protein [Octopus vulgaris]|uniref:Uncharacterized protein n=1 Tax=Octopus vulgaris TaxID=6645 RepID=A0AA36F7T1_OCTVU|nr:Hypothetical predicted protein [Octopus vulgaris]